MRKRRLSIIAIALFLTQGIIFSGDSSAEIQPLNPQTKVNLNESNAPFKQTYELLCVALSIYKADAINRQSKSNLIKEYSKTLFNSEVRFDLEHIDLGKRGWTRHYPFSIGERSFIVRIFLTEERIYQSNVPVLYEADIKNPPVTFQVLPGVNAILRDCRIRPYNAYSYREVATSP